MIVARAKLSSLRHLLLVSALAATLCAAQLHAAPLLDEVFGSGDAPPPPPALSTSATDAALAASDNTNQPLSILPAKADRNADVASAARSQASTNGFLDTLANFGPASGTEVGQRAIELHEEVLRLRATVANDSNIFTTLRANGAAGAVQYHSTVAAITARLQNGTTRGNPILQRQWHEAEQSLNLVNDSLAQLNTLGTSVTNDASVAGYLLESVRAALQLSGAVDEDHDQLVLLRDEVSRLIVQTDYLRTEVSADIQRQTSYLTSERNNLQALSFGISRGEMFGANMVNHPVMMNSAPVMSLPMASPSMPVSRGSLNSKHSAMNAPGESDATAQDGMTSAGKLLVLIRFNQDNVPYERQLSQAVSTALERRPNAQFTIVGVAPTRGDAQGVSVGSVNTQHNMDAVKTTLLQMGLDPSKISVTNTQGATTETPEVHVYVR